LNNRLVPHSIHFAPMI